MKNKYIEEMNSIHASDSFKEEMIQNMNQQTSPLSIHWYKVSFACICACLIFISFISVSIWNELNHTQKVLNSIQNELNQMNKYVSRNDKAESIDSLLGGLDLLNGMGMSGIITESVEDLAIDSSTLNVTSLPIYKNSNQRKDSGEIINLRPLSERKQIFNTYLKRYGMENYEIVEEFDTLIVRNNQMVLRFYDNNHVSMWLNEEYPNQYSIKIYGKTKEEVIQNIKQLLLEYDSWFDDKEYEIEVNKYYYEYFGYEETQLLIGWNIDITSNSEHIALDVNEEGYLQGIRYTLQTKIDTYQSYPIISFEKAKEMLLKGYFYVDGPYGNVNKIVGAELKYYGNGEYLLPYYVIYMPAIHQNKMIEFKGLTEYTYVYVPAIDLDLLAQDNIYYPNLK